MNNLGLGKFSSKLFTLNTFYSANKIVVGGKIEDKTESFLTRYWEMVVVNICLLYTSMPFLIVLLIMRFILVKGKPVLSRFSPI